MKKINFLLLILFGLTASLYGAYTKDLTINFSMDNIIANWEFSNISIVPSTGEVNIGIPISTIYTGNESMVSEVFITENFILFSTLNPLSLYYYSESDGVKKVADFFSHSMINKIRKINNKIYISTSSPGAVYVYENNEIKKLVEIDQHVWDIFYFNGKIYLLTGLPASVYELSGGIPKLIFRSNFDKHFISSFVSKNEVLIGSSGSATIYSLDIKGNIAPIFSLGNGDITSLSKYGGKVIFSTYVSEAPQKDSSQDTTNYVTLPVSRGEISVIEDGKYKSIYNGFGISSFVIIQNKVLACTEKGLMEIDLSDYSQRKFYLYNQSFSKIFSENNMVYLSSLNVASVSKLEMSASGILGQLLTPELSVRNIKKWGKVVPFLKIPKNSYVEIFAKGGNSPREDSSWSDWVKVTNRLDLLSYQFIKLKFIFKANSLYDTPSLKMLKVFYTPFNSEPRITGVTTKDLDDKIEFVISAGDPDNDQLAFDIFYKESLSTKWIKINLEPFTNLSYSVSKNILGDGIFDFKIIASDYLSNPPGEDIKREYYLKDIMIDTKPIQLLEDKITVKLESKKALISFTLKDNIWIKEVAFSLDGNKWVYILPVDDVVDDSIETFSVSLEISNETKNIPQFLVRAKDFGNNVSTFRIGPFTTKQALNQTQLSN